MKAEKTLARIDRICTARLMGELSAEQAMTRVTEAIGEWTDPKDEEERLHPFIGMSSSNPDEIWCTDCEYHRDHPVHGGK